MTIDLIDFNSIKMILNIEASISDIITNPSISLVLQYTLDAGNGRIHMQQYFLVGKPQEVYAIFK